MKNEILLIAAMLSMCLLSAMSFSEGGPCSVSLYTDKTSYIPAERIYIYGTLQEPCPNRANTDVAVEVRGPDSSIIFADQVRSDNSGVYSTSFIAPLSMAPGTYTISLSTAGASNEKTFEIESFFDVLIVDTDKGSYVKGQSVDIHGILYTLGAPAGAEQVAITVKDNSGNIIYVSQATTDPLGVFTDTFRITPSMQVSEYTLYAAHDRLVAENEFKVYPGVIINEVMFYPPADDAGLEFIELYNAYDEDVDMAGWYLKSSWGAVNVLTSGNTLLEGGAFAAVITDTYVMPSGVHFRTGAYVLGRLPNTAGTITLFDDNDNMIDSFTYKSTYGTDRDGSSVIDTLGEGSSLERIDPYVLTNYYANWDSGIGTPTLMMHNTVYIGALDADAALLFADAPRYAMAHRDIRINTRVKNNAGIYDLVTLAYMINTSIVDTKGVLVDPMAYRDYTHQFMLEAGDFMVNVALVSEGNLDDSLITVVPPVMDGPDIVELYRCRLLLPAIVPRNNTFQIIALLTNDYGDDITDITVELALPDAGGFAMSGTPVHALALLESNSFDAAAVYDVGALADTPDGMLGKRTFSVYSEGTLGSEPVWDADYRTTEIISHSSPVLSLDLTVPEQMSIGETYQLLGAAFNTGTEGAEGLILTIDSDGLEVLSDDMIVIDALEPSSFEMYSFEVRADKEGEYDIVLEIMNHDGDSYALQKTLYVAGQQNTHPQENDDAGRKYTAASAPDDEKHDAVAPYTDDGKAGETEDAPDTKESNDINTFEEDEDMGVPLEYAGKPDVETTPTGNVSAFYAHSRYTAGVIGILLFAVLGIGLLKHKVSK